MSDSASVARPTTDSGVPIASDRHSLTVGPKGGGQPSLDSIGRSSATHRVGAALSAMGLR
jgi:hypothetical protein